MVWCFVVFWGGFFFSFFFGRGRERFKKLVYLKAAISKLSRPNLMHWSHSVTLSFPPHSSRHTEQFLQLHLRTVITLDTRNRAQSLSVLLLSSHHFSPEGFKSLAEHTSTAVTFPRYIFSLVYSYSWKGSRCSPSFIVLLAFYFPLIAGILSLLPINRDSQGWRVAPASSNIAATGKCDGGVLGYWEYRRGTCDCTQELVTRQGGRCAHTPTSSCLPEPLD